MVRKKNWIAEDKVSRVYFRKILNSYPNALLQEGKSNLDSGPAVLGSPDETNYFDVVKDAVEPVLRAKSQNIFVNYEEFTSGSTGLPKQCLRPSISWHMEFLRLRELVGSALLGTTMPFHRANHIMYYSRYGQSSFVYTDTGGPPLHVEKYVYDNVEDMFERLSAFHEPFILSGSPSSMIELLDLGFDQFSPALVLLSGERCPKLIKNRIKILSPHIINMIVARETGLLGFECPLSTTYHFFSNCLKVSRNTAGRLQVADPTNYLRPQPLSTDDEIAELVEDICDCGFNGLSSTKFEGRPYKKSYPAL